MKSHPRIAAALAAVFIATLLLFTCCTTAPAPRPTTTPSAVVLPPMEITVLGFDSPKVAASEGDPDVIVEPYDAIVVGGGLSGLTASWYLRDRQVLCLERETTAGGLAFKGTTPEGVTYGRGAAYYSKPRARAAKIYEELGLDPLEKTAIPEPIDSYFWNGTLYRGVWEPETLHKLPRAFGDFKKALLDADEKGWVPEQPIDEAKDLRLDLMTAAKFIEPYGPDVKAFLDAYCQSALGSKSDDVNALAFVNFYLAEVETRYAWAGGTAGAAAQLIAKIQGHNKAILRTGAAVTKVKNIDGAVEVTWTEGGKSRRATAKYAIMAVPLRTSSWIVDGYPAERRALVDKLPYADYLLHNVFTSKELYTASYDTWLCDRPVSDIITARWIETKGFAAAPAKGPGILTVYQPLAPFRHESLKNEAHVKELAIASVKEAAALVPGLLKESSLRVESYRWPGSIHIVPVGFFSEWVPKLKAPFGRIHFAGNNLGTPSFEEALYRGWRAAKDLEKLFSRVRTRELEYAFEGR